MRKLTAQRQNGKIVLVQTETLEYTTTEAVKRREELLRLKDNLQTRKSRLAEEEAAIDEELLQLDALLGK